MSPEHLVDQYGYLAVLIGTFLEGETILVLGGLAAKLGHLTLGGVILAGFVGSLCGDQLYFFLGRYYGRALLERRPLWRDKAAHFDRLLVRWGNGLILSFRFLYGLRTVAPFVIGMSAVSVPRFVVLNMTGAALWAALVGTLGYLFGNGLELVFGNLQRYRLQLVVAGAVIGALIWVVYLYRSRRQAQQSGAARS